MNAAANLLIAKVQHRLEQLTRPVFERDVVEQLIELALSAQHAEPLAPQLGEAHNALDEAHENIAALERNAAEQRGVIDGLACQIQHLQSEVHRLSYELHLKQQRPAPPVNPLITGVPSVPIAHNGDYIGYDEAARRGLITDDLNRGMQNLPHPQGVASLLPTASEMRRRLEQKLFADPDDDHPKWKG